MDTRRARTPLLVVGLVALVAMLLIGHDLLREEPDAVGRGPTSGVGDGAVHL